MIKKATFYLLKNDRLVGALSAQEAIACTIASERWRSGTRSLIFCETQEQAVRLDEALWHGEKQAFVPHNLVGEGLRLGAPVELCWPSKHCDTRRDLLITLQLKFSDFAADFQQVVEFVPYESKLKKLARERYKAYRSAGFHLTVGYTTNLIKNINEKK